MPDVGPTLPSKPEARAKALADAATVYDMHALDVRATNASPVRRGLPMSGKRLTLLATGGLVTIVAVVVVAILLRSKSTIDALEQMGTETSASAALDAGTADAAPRAVASAAPEVARPSKQRVSAAELDEARMQGVGALAALTERYGDDPALLKALVLAYTKDKKSYGKAVTSARKLLEVAPEKASDPDIGRALVMIANGPVDVAASALDIMATSMGSRGPDQLYELLLASSVGKYPKERAAQLLRDPAVQKLATPAVLIANELRAATGCDKRPFFARAVKEGDERALAQLKPLLSKKGCKWHGQGDCFDCLGDRSELKAIIDALTKRLAAPASASVPPKGGKTAP
jgi:hypothetical protein